MVKCFKETNNVSSCKISISTENGHFLKLTTLEKKLLRSLHTELVVHGSLDHTILLWTLEQNILYLLMLNSLKE